MGDILKILFSHTAYGKPGGLYIEGPLFFVVASLAAVVGIFGASMVWVYRDAINRGKNPIVTMLFILLTGWPGSFIWWLWLRPALKDQSFESQDAVHVHLPPVPSHSHI
jgi:hypothetical protein